nr:glycosyl transferase group 1 [uncultured bacterium]
MTIGTLQPRKNLARLLAAHAALPAELRRAHPLLVVGSRGWAAEEEIGALSGAVAKGNAMWLQHVPDEELSTIFQNACALALPSLYEGFGLPLVEAFASGIPVLTSNVSAMPEVAGNAAVYVDPLDEKQIADGLQRILVDEGLRAELVSLGTERAREFSWQRCARQTLDVYRKVA